MEGFVWTEYTRFAIARGSGIGHAALLVTCIIGVAAVCWTVLRWAERVGRWLGPIGLKVAVRLFGLVLAAIAVEYIVNGLKLLLPVLGG